MAAEIELAPVDALQDGEMRAFPVPDRDQEVLLVRQQGQYVAFAPNCPHYGAPLAKGKLVAGRIVCPWHHACFHAQTGALAEPPALDCLPRFPLREAGGKLWVQLPADPPAATDDPNATPTAETGGVPPAPPAPATDDRTFVLVGNGAAGYFAAQTLREEGFSGRIILLTADPTPTAYDRTKLSKAYLAGKAEADTLPLRKPDFYEQHRLEVRPNTRVTGLDRAKRELWLENQPPLSYDALLLAPGSHPNELADVPGHDLAGVVTLRTRPDAEELLAQARDARHVVIIGASFIGLEAASSLVSDERRVTVVAQSKEPFEKVLGPEIGKMFRQLHQEKGVQFVTEAQVEALEGTAGRVSAVRLTSGQTLPADLVLLGVGVQPATDFLQTAFALEEDGGLRVDAFLAAADHIWAAGDIARYPSAQTGELVRVEHWRVAQQQGRCAARNMLGQQVAYTAAPFFWTQQYGKSLRYAGHATEWDDIIYHGQVGQQDFLALYVRNDQVVAAAAMNRDPAMICFAALLEAGRLPAPTELRAEVDWNQLTAQL